MNLHPLSRGTQSRRDVLRLDALAILKDLTGDLVGIEDVDNLLWSIAERTISKLGWCDCVIYLLDPKSNVLIQKAAFGPKSIDYKSIFKPISIPVGLGVVGKVASTGKALRVKNTSAILDYIEDDAVRLSELAVPILWGDQVLGVIDSEHPESDFYQEEDQLILETLAGITATKIQNAKSVQASHDLALFYECNPNPVLQIDSERTITYINDSAKRCFNQSLTKGGTVNQPGLSKALDQAVHSGKATWRCRALNSDSENSERTREFSIVHLPSGLFNLYGSDISHFLTLQKAAEAATEAKSRFLSVMSHEIRTPLNAILGLTDLLIQSHSSRDEQLRHLAYMEFSGRHLLSLVNDILDLEKMASGKAQSSPSRLNLREYAASIIHSFENRAKNVGLELSLEIAQHCPEKICADAKWLTQILNNLISNAIKYTEEGSVYLGISIVENTPAAEDATSEQLVRFAVTDTGHGIAQNELQRILEPFEQINNTSQIEGTGLGLAIVQGIVQQMSGELSIKSKLGVGSTFTVDLPLTLTEDPEPSAYSPPSHVTTAALGSDQMPNEKAQDKPPCTVLLADDNELNRFVANKILKRWGYNVLEAVNGADAVQLWNEKNPTLILMDIQMPVMDGIAAALQIRNEEQEKGLPRTPIIALTADAEQQTYEKIQSVGMDNRIVKPFDPVTLRDLIDRTVASSAKPT